MRRVCHFLCFTVLCTTFNAPPDPAAEEDSWDSQRIILAVFLGGCTFSEISALRFLGKERGTEQSRERGLAGQVQIPFAGVQSLCRATQLVHGCLWKGRGGGDSGSSQTLVRVCDLHFPSLPFLALSRAPICDPDDSHH